MSLTHSLFMVECMAISSPLKIRVPSPNTSGARGLTNDDAEDIYEYMQGEGSIN